MSDFMKKLIVATDLSPRSDRAMNRALALSDELKTKLVVLHIVDDELPNSLAASLKDEAESIIDDQLDAFPTLKRENVTHKVVFGSVFREILKEAEEGVADLIIMGTHRDEGLSSMFLGTTVERVIRHGNTPVLVVKDRVNGPYCRALVGIDFSVYSRRAVEFALKFVPRAEIFLLHAYDVPFKGFLPGRAVRDEIKKIHQDKMDTMLDEEMESFLRSLPSPPTPMKRVMAEGMAGTVISAQTKKIHPDLLIVGTHGRTGVAHALLGSVAEDLLSEPPCDVLAVKAW